MKIGKVLAIGAAITTMQAIPATAQTGRAEPPRVPNRVPAVGEVLPGVTARHVRQALASWAAEYRTGMNEDEFRRLVTDRLPNLGADCERNPLCRLIGEAAYRRAIIAFWQSAARGASLEEALDRLEAEVQSRLESSVDADEIARAERIDAELRQAIERGRISDEPAAIAGYMNERWRTIPNIAAVAGASAPAPQADASRRGTEILYVGLRCAFTNAKSGWNYRALVSCAQTNWVNFDWDIGFAVLNLDLITIGLTTTHLRGVCRCIPENAERLTHGVYRPASASQPFTAIGIQWSYQAKWIAVNLLVTARFPYSLKPTFFANSSDAGINLFVGSYV